MAGGSLRLGAFRDRCEATEPAADLQPSLHGLLQRLRAVKALPLEPPHGLSQRRNYALLRLEHDVPQHVLLRLAQHLCRAGQRTHPSRELSEPTRTCSHAGSRRIGRRAVTGRSKLSYHLLHRRLHLERQGDIDLELGASGRRSRSLGSGRLSRERRRAQGKRKEERFHRRIGQGSCHENQG